jgi:hypothetical protein
VAYPRDSLITWRGSELDTYGGTFSIRVGIEADLTSQPGEFVLRGGCATRHATTAAACFLPAFAALPVRVTRTAEQTTEAAPGKPVACGAETA